jgi:hypothetical protein
MGDVPADDDALQAIRLAENAKEVQAIDCTAVIWRISEETIL